MDSREIELMDARLRAAFSEEPPDASAVQLAVRKHIAEQQRRHWMRAWVVVGLAAAVILAVVGYGAFRRTGGTNVYADLAQDHRREVVDRQPRHWRSAPEELDPLIARYGVTDRMVAGLAPSGYRLEHAKTCLMAGKPVLHMVYSDGSREFSVYVRKQSGAGVRSGSASVGSEQGASEQVAVFHRDGFEAAVVTVGSSAECMQLARRAASAL